MILFKNSKMRETIHNGDRAKVTELLDAGVSPNGGNGENAFLCLALRAKNLDIFTLLVQRGAQVDINCLWDRNLLHIAAVESQIEYAALVLRHKPALIHDQDRFGKTPLDYAIEYQQINFVRFLLDNGAVAVSGTDKTPLEQALGKGDMDIALLLLERISVSRAPLSTLQWVLQNSTTKLATAWLTKISEAAGAEPLLHQAAKAGYSSDTIDFLLDHGQVINLPDAESGGTTLHLAAARGHLKIVTCLLKRGADTTARDANGDTPLDLARKNGHEDIAGRLALYEPVKTEEWRPLPDDRIAHILRDEEIGYRLTEIFNFARRERTQIYHNLETKAEAMETRDFDEITEKEPLEHALRQMAASGVETEHLSIRGIVKNTQPLPGK